MTTNTMAGLFNIQTPEQLNQKYFEGMLAPDAQLNQLPLLQQVVAMGRNAGAGVGYAGGLMSGGMAPEAATAQKVEQVLQATSKYADPRGQASAASEMFFKMGMPQQGYLMLDKMKQIDAERLATDTAQAQLDKLKAETGKIANLKEVVANRVKALQAKFPNEDPSFYQAIAEDNKAFADAIKSVKPEKLSDFEKLIKDLPPEKQAELKRKRAEALAGGDPTGQRAALNDLTAALKQAQIDALKDKAAAKRDKAEAAKAADINNLASSIADTTNAMNTAAQAMKMAPNTWLGGTAQAIFGSVPWTNQQALSDMVSTLRANQAFGKLLEMKRASPTGASGLGAVSEAELKLLTDNIATLNPSAKNFKSQLTKVINSWTRVRDQMSSEYQRLAGRPYDIPSAESTQTETASSLSPEDAKALAWANANPNDPRAAKIKAKLGVK